MDKRRPLLLLLAMLPMAVAGCAGHSPFAYLGGADLLAEASLPSKEANAQVHVASLPPQPAAAGLGQRPTAPPKGLSQTLASALKKAGSTVTEALTIKPKVIPPNDPISLASNPGPIDADLYISAGRIHEQHGNFDAARKQYERALKIEPRNLKALLSAARLHDRLEQFDQAVALYQRAVSAHPDSAIAWNDLGLCYARQGKLDLARQTLSRAVRLQPKRKLYRNNLAVVLIELGRPDEAYSQLAAVHGPAIAHYNLGYFLYQRDQYRQAIDHFAKAAEMDPQLTAARKMLQQLGARPPANQHGQVGPPSSGGTMENSAEQTDAVDQLSHAEVRLVSVEQPATEPAAGADEQADPTIDTEPAGEMPQVPPMTMPVVIAAPEWADQPPAAEADDLQPCQPARLLSPVP